MHKEIHICQENQANLAFTLAKNCFNLTFYGMSQKPFLYVTCIHHYTQPLILHSN